MICSTAEILLLLIISGKAENKIRKSMCEIKKVVSHSRKKVYNTGHNVNRIGS